MPIIHHCCHEQKEIKGRQLSNAIDLLQKDMESEQLEREKQKADVQKQQEVQQEQGEDLQVSMAHA